MEGIRSTPVAEESNQIKAEPGSPSDGTTELTGGIPSVAMQDRDGGPGQQQARLTDQRHGRLNAPGPLRELPTEPDPKSQFSIFTKLQLCTRSDAGYRRGKDESARIPASEKLSYSKKSRQGSFTSATNSG